MARLEPDDLTAQWQARQARERLDALAGPIRESSRWHAAMARLRDARSRRDRLVRLKIQKAREESRRRETERRRQEARRLHEQAQEAMRQGDLRRARRTLARLEEVDSGHEELAALRHAVEEAISAKVQELLGRGNALYRDGAFAEAKAVWEAALELDPGDEKVKPHVERAERVLGRLRELKAD